MSKSLAIITWVTYRNFGTFLQAFALQQYLCEKGFDCKILNDSSYIINYKPNWKHKLKKLFLKLVQKDFREFEKSCTKSHSLFNKFKQNMLHIDYNHQLSSLDSKYDIYICGSDQIWNPFFLDNPNSGFFYASFTKKKKIAYAPSIGVSKVPHQYKEKFKKQTICFDYLSAREQQGVDALQELTGKNVSKVVDPTLLLDADEWNQLLPIEPPCQQKYILAYFLTPNKVFIDLAIEYAQRKNIRVKIFFTDKSYYGYDCDLIAAGPIEFLHYVKHAECLFTDSFHGSIFANIFHTQFFTFRRFKQIAESQNSRVENLLTMMGIGERLFDEKNCNTIYKLADIDFKQISRNITPFIEKSKHYLLNTLQ